MTLLNYAKGLWTALLPAATKVKMENIEDGIKAASDILDLETDAGRAITQAADAAAQRSALGLGDSATKNVGTGAGDVAAGNAPAGAVTTHESTYAHANLPTADEKTRLSDIQAATGATTALKLANLASPATPTQRGVALLGASGGAAKLTKMPDGATAVYSNDAWPTVWPFYDSGASVASVSGGVIRCTKSAATVGGLGKDSDYSGKLVIARIRASKAATIIYTYATSTNFASFAVGTDWTICAAINPIKDSSDISRLYIRNTGLDSGNWFEIDWIWIGDYSYLTGTLSEEAARIANELGDTAGVGVAASGNIDFSTAAPVQVGDTVTVHGKPYQFVASLSAAPGVEGEILWNSDVYVNHERLRSAIVSGGDGTFSWATIHPTVTMTRPGGNLIGIVSAKNPGLRGNNITLSALAAAVSAGRITLSGSTLTGGKDAVGEKIRTQVENYIAGSGTRPAAAKTELTDNTKIGFEDEVDRAVGATLTFPAGGTWIWFVHGYGSNVGGLKKGSSAGGATITMAGVNGSIWYRKFS